MTGRATPPGAAQPNSQQGCSMDSQQSFMGFWATCASPPWQEVLPSDSMDAISIEGSWEEPDGSAMGATVATANTDWTRIMAASIQCVVRVMLILRSLVSLRHKPQQQLAKLIDRDQSRVLDSESRAIVPRGAINLLTKCTSKSLLALPRWVACPPHSPGSLQIHQGSGPTGSR